MTQERSAERGKAAVELDRHVRAIFSALPDGIVLVDDQGTIVYVNSRLEQLTGYGRDELIGARIEFLVPESPRRTHVVRRTEFLRRRRLRPMGAGLNIHLRRADGSELPVDIQLSPTELEGETLTVASVRDITDRRAAEDALKDSEARLKTAQQDVATLSRSLLPRLPKPPGITVYGSYLPAVTEAQIGGDWYDLVPLESRRVGLVVGDVAGHGVRAAAVMGQLRTGLRAYMREGHGPADALQRTDTLTVDMLPSLMTTVWCGVLDIASGRLSYASGGHPPPAVITPSGDLRFLDHGQNPPLGVRWAGPFSQGEARLASGSTLVCYTDGLIERPGEPLDHGLERLAEALGQSFVGLEELAERLLELPVDDHVDDVAVLAVSRDAPTSDEIKFRSEVVAEPEALAEMRGRFYAWLGEEGIPHSVAADAVLAASEAVANAVEHAYLNTDGIVVVSASIVEDELRVRVDDTGSWRPFPHDGSAGRGRGFAIMEGLMDDIDVHSSTTGTHVQLSRRLEGLDS